MKPILSLILSLTILALQAQSDQLKNFRTKWANAAEYTMEVLEAMPADKMSYRPSAEVRTFEEQLLHMAQNARWLTQTYLTDEQLEIDLKTTGLSKAELKDKMTAVFDFSKKALDEVEDHDLKMRVRFFAGPMQVQQILTLMNDHLTHHRGQIVVYLRMNGIKPPGYRGW